jgi:hypothetical protein
MNLGIGGGSCDDLAANGVWEVKQLNRHNSTHPQQLDLHISPPISQYSFTQKSANRMFTETSTSPDSTTRVKSIKPNLKHYFLRCSGTCTFASCAYFCRELSTIKNRLTVFPLLVEESDLERNGDVTDVTLVTLVTVIGCTDKEKCYTVNLVGPTDETNIFPLSDNRQIRSFCHFARFSLAEEF